MSPLPPALVLTAGLGTRLRPLTARRAKPSLPVARQSLVERVLAGLRARGVTDAVLNLHHHPASIASIVGDGSPFGMRVRYSLEPELLGSAGGPRHALPLIDADPFFIINGDTLTDVDLAGMLDAHRLSGARVTMAVIANPAPGHYGGIEADAEGAARAFVGAAAWRARHADDASTPVPWHFIGVQVAHRDVFAALPDRQPAESVRGVYRDLVASEPGAVRIFTSQTHFFDIGTPAEYHRSARAHAHGDDALLVSEGASVDDSAHLHETIVLEGASIGARARLERCIVCDTTRVPDGHADRDAILGPADWVDEAPGGVCVGGLARWPMTRG